MAGKDWANPFLKHNQPLSLLSPEATSVSRMINFNRVQVGKFFELLRSELEKYETTDQKPGKILAKE